MSYWHTCLNMSNVYEIEFIEYAFSRQFNACLNASLTEPYNPINLLVFYIWRLVFVVNDKDFSLADVMLTAKAILWSY